MATLYAAALALVGWVAGLDRLRDNSFLWHLRTGLWILDHHTVPRGDLYSYTVPGHPWVVQSWLAELLYGVTDRGLGPSGIRLLTAGLGAAIGYSAFRLAHRITGRRVAAAGISFLAVLASAELWTTRPLLLGLCAFMALLWIVELPDRAAGRHPMVAIPVVMWVWANVHGSFALGFGYLLLHLTGAWLDGRPPWRGPERRIGQAAVVAFGACFVNPYGPALVLFPVQLLRRGDVLNKIGEWQSPDFRSPLGITLALWSVLLIVVLARAGRRVTWRDLLVAVGFLVLALWAQRNALLAPMAGLPVVARALATTKPATEQTARGRINITLLAVIVLLGGGVAAKRLSEPAFDLHAYPVAAMRAVQARGLLGRPLLTTDAWAGFVINAYWPRQRVFLDDRYDMYPEDLAQDYFRLQNGEPGWSSTLSRYGIEVVVWTPPGPLPQYLAFAPGWTRIYQDRVAVVFAKVPPPS